MKVLFVYFDFMAGAGGKYYEGLASLSAVLKQRRHEVRLCHLVEKISVETFMETFRDRYQDSDLIGFSATSNVFPYVEVFSKAIKETFPDKLTICGGPHPTLSPEDSLKTQGLDVVCRGEGEYALAELCDQLEAHGDITQIEGLWVKQNGMIFRNSMRPFIQNLDELPMPDRDLFVFEASMDEQIGRMPFMGSRGCPYNCSHCCNHAFKDLCSTGCSYVRFKSSDRLIEEIRTTLARHPNVKAISFLDDILLLKKSWYTEFLDKYKDQIRMPFNCNVRFEQINPDMLQKAKEAGCFRIQVGLESGNESIRNDVLKRKQSNELILSAGKMIREAGIPLYLFNMVGIPFETLSAALDTVKMNARLNAASVQVSIYYPYEKTQLYEISKEKGFLSNKHFDSYFISDTTLKLPGFPPDQIRFAYENFVPFVSYYKFLFSKPGLLHSILERIVDFLWLHPPIYGVINPLYRRLKRLYKAINKK